MRVICLDDKNRPKDIPVNKWVVKDEFYTVLEFVKMELQGGKLGVKLKEIDLTDCFPYEFFDANRFGVTEADLKKYEEEMLEKEKETQKELEVVE